MTDEKRREELKELLRKRLAETPAALMLARLDYFMSHCWKCDAKVAWSAEVCERCGEELM